MVKPGTPPLLVGSVLHQNEHRQSCKELEGCTDLWHQMSVSPENQNLSPYHLFFAETVVVGAIYVY